MGRGPSVLGLRSIVSMSEERADAAEPTRVPAPHAFWAAERLWDNLAGLLARVAE
jgi:hypothetical protein